MKKILFTILLIVTLGMISTVHADCIRTQSGFMIYHGNCEHGDDQQYVFDVLFEKDGYEGMYNETLDLTRYTDAWGNRPNENQHVLTEALPYMSMDNEFISLIGYGTDLGYHYNNNCYQGIMHDMYDEQHQDNPYLYGDFKIVVLDMDYNVVFTSETYSKDLLPDPENEVYSEFRYDDISNSISLFEHDMYVHWIEPCNDTIEPGDYIMWITSFLLLVGTVALFLGEAIYLAMKKARLLSVFISFIVGVVSLWILSNFYIFEASELIITSLIILSINFAKYLLFKYIEGRSHQFTFFRKGLLIFLGLYTLMPFIIRIYIEIVSN